MACPPHQDPNGENNDEDQGGADGQSFEQVGTGSGVILEVDGNTGYILTNNHVAGGAAEMVVTLADGRQIANAKLVGADPKSDLAVVKIQADKLIPAKWGDSATLRKGDWILAFGSPFGYIGSMTHGIVSALDRSNVGILGSQGYEDFIQVDAPINPGNSGGPLVNLHGEVVGINTAIASRSGAFSGIGFAIPSNEAKFVYTALKSHGKVTRGWLGVSIADVARNEKEAESFGYKGTTGVLVEQTFPNTPCHRQTSARRHHPIARWQARRQRPGASQRHCLHRAQHRHHHDGFPRGQRPASHAQTRRAARRLKRPGRHPWARPSWRHWMQRAVDALGMTFSSVTGELAEKFGLTPDQQGALVTSVKPKSPAAKAGIRPGDLVTKVGGSPVKSAKEASDAISKSDPKKGIRLYVTGPEGSRFVFIQAE